MPNDGGAAKAAPDATRLLDPAMAERLVGPALPFGGGVTTAHCLLDAPEGAPRVPVAFGALAWRHAGALRLTVVLKASFSMGGEPGMTPADAPEPYRTADLHHRDRPLAHVLAASDRAPWKTAIDVTLVGHAQAPGGKPVPEMLARLMIVQAGETALDKRARVMGDRASATAAPRPFARMPLTYERAVGGGAIPENPIGRGDEDEPPNVLDVVDPTKPLGFGPVPAAWPIRHGRLGATPRRALDAPIMELPSGFPFDYFQSAPRDQRLARLDADAGVVLGGLDPARERIALRLPGARAVGAVYGLDDRDPDAPTELAFRADTLHLDADRWIATLTFRAYAAVREEAQLGRLLVAAGVGLGDRTPRVPPRRPGAAGTVSPLAARELPAPAETGTMMVVSEPATARLALPFAVGQPAPSPGAAAAMGPQAAPSPAAFALAPPTAPSPGAAFALAPPTAPSPGLERRFGAEVPGPGPGPLPVLGAMAYLAGPPPAPVLGAGQPVWPGLAPGLPLPPPPPNAPGPPLPGVPARSASDFFHDPAKLAEADRAAAAPPAPPLPPPVEAEPVPLELYARGVVALAEPDARVGEVLDALGIEPTAWRKADRRWVAELGQEVKLGQRALRDRFDAAYVSAWEEKHPGRFTLAHFGRLRRAEERGLLQAEIEALGLPAPLATRLRRVWRSRVAASPALREQLERDSTKVSGLAAKGA